MAVAASIVALTVVFYMAVLGGLGNQSFITVGIAFMLGTDGLLLVLVAGRRVNEQPTGGVGFRTDVSVIIACYNGADVIGRTIEHLLPHVPPRNIIVVSDCSTDNTVDVASGYGVTILENRFNRNKALSINRAAPMVTTPYALVLDDDTHVGPEPLPVELLDEGHAAVAFEVMPISDGSFINRLQTYEYRKAMTFGKALMSEIGAVANVSGAVGLFRTADLRKQASRHSGHFPGEDLQRTLLAHLESDGTGVAFSPNRVVTLAPSSWRELFTQRSKKWGAADHELLFMNLRLMGNARVHPLLRFERGYSVFVLLTDPVRMVFFVALLAAPQYFAFLYLLYLPLEFAAWLRLGRRDQFRVVLAAPLYNIFKLVARFSAHFYWFRMKWDYLVRRQYHRLVPGRNLLAEYAGITVAIAAAWAITIWGAIRAFT